MIHQEDHWLKQRRKKTHKRKQRQKEYQIEQDAINACEIQREKDRRLLYLYLRIKRMFHLKKNTRPSK